MCIFTKLKKCHLQSDNLKFLIFDGINWLANSIDGYKCPCNLVELLEKDLNFEKELEGRIVHTKCWKIFFSFLHNFFN
jgi:hypothetical protein